MTKILLLCLLVLMALLGGASAQPGAIDAQTRRDVVEAIALELGEKYVFEDLGRQLAARLRRSLRDGDYDDYADGPAFAEKLGADLQAWAGDGHLNVEYSPEPLAEDTDAANGAWNEQEMERYYGAHINHGFSGIERLDGNIAVMKLDVFPPPVMGGDTAVAAMNFVASMDALIIDLRENGGGDGETGTILASYLFDEGGKELTGYYAREEERTYDRFTMPYVPGRRFDEGKPVFVLISGKTFSAAEAFAYDLQALGRATVVGEASGGGAHPFSYQKVHDHFILWLVTGRSVNPITGGNWQGTGVIPDVDVPAGEALETAVDLARAALSR